MLGRFLHSNFRKAFFPLLFCLLTALIAQRTLVAQQKPSFVVVSTLPIVKSGGEWIASVCALKTLEALGNPTKM